VAKQASSLQFGHNLIHEVIEAFRHEGEHDVEAVATLLKEPLLHFISDGRRRAYKGEPAETAGDLGELPHR
jgi:hypothetical protein